MKRFFKRVLRNFKKTKIINSYPFDCRYDLSSIQMNIIQLLDELDKEVQFKCDNIACATKLDLEVLVGMLTANIEKRSNIHYFLSAVALFVAFILGIGLAIKAIFVVSLFILVFLALAEKSYDNRVERLVLVRELLLLYIERKYSEKEIGTGIVDTVECNSIKSRTDLNDNKDKVVKSKINKLIGKLMFGKLEKEEEMSRIKFVSINDKNEMILELEEKLKDIPYEYSLNEQDNEKLIAMLRKNQHDEMETTSIERIKIIFETSSQHFGNLNNVILYLSIVLGILSPGTIMFASRIKDLNGQIMAIGTVIILFVLLYIVVILGGLKKLERQHRNLSQIVKYIELILK